MRYKLVRQRGFEPPHPKALPPQGSVSTVPPLTHKIGFMRVHKSFCFLLLSDKWVSVKSDKSNNKCIDNLCFNHSKSDKHSSHQFTT